MDKYSPEREKKRFERSWIVNIAGAVFFAAATLIMVLVWGGNALSVEMSYSRGVYRAIAPVLGFITGWFGFSLGEFLLYAAVAAVAVCVLLLAVNAFRLRWRAVVSLLLAMAFAASLLVFVFYAFWGMNYSRMPLSESLGLNVTERSAEELSELCMELARDANGLRAAIGDGEDGTVKRPEGDLLAGVPSYFKKLGGKSSFFDVDLARPKTVAWSEGLSWLGITGIFLPFTGESNVNMHQSAFMIPATAAHECAHQLGITREDEANFAAYLACAASGDAYAEYSGTILALIYCGNALYGADADMYAKLYASYSQGVKRDLASHSEYWKNYEGPAKEAATDMNDTYLKVNGLDDGVDSYGRMVDLMLAAREKGMI